VRMNLRQAASRVLRHAVLAFSVNILLLGTVGQVSAASTGALPVAAVEPRVDEVAVDRVFEYRVWKFSAPETIETVAKDAASYATPEDARIAQWSAMMARDVQWFLDGWEVETRERVAREVDLKELAARWDSVVGRRLRLLRRAETGGYAIVESEIEDGPGGPAPEYPWVRKSDVVFCLMDERWVWTDALASDPVALLWREPGIGRLVVIVRAVDDGVEKTYDAYPGSKKATGEAFDGVRPKVPPPRLPAKRAEVKHVVIEEHYRYKVWELEPAIVVHPVPQGRASYKTPEDAVIAQFSATMAGDYEWYLQGWAKEERNEVRQRQDKETWRRDVAGLAGSTVRILRRAETLGHVLMEFRVDLGRGASDKRLKEGGVVLKQEDGRWVYTNELAEDPVVMLWRTPTKRTTLIGRRESGGKM
jgi:hypothetical protein